MDIEFFKRDILPLKNKLFRYAKSILNNEELAEDVVQETLLQVWEKRNEIDAIKNIEAWCMTITRNFALGKLRLKSYQNKSLDILNDPIEPDLPPDKMLEKEDIINKIDEFVRLLPLKQKEIFQLRDIEGFSYQEISQITGHPLSDIKIAIYRARKTLKNQLQKIYEYERF